MARRDRPEVHLRMLTPADAAWLVEVDRASAGNLAELVGFDPRSLPDELEAGYWASDERSGWAVMVDGDPGGFATVVHLEADDALMQIRIREELRGRGVGREVLRQIADHHFKADTSLQRLVGNTHEANTAMQRAFNAAGFRLESRFRDAFEQEDGALADLWGYALTRGDWEAGRTRDGEVGWDLHGLRFTVEEVLDGPTTGSTGLTFTFLQEGRRVTATFWSRDVSDGELGGVMIHDTVHYHYRQGYDPAGSSHHVVTGTGTARVQRAGDGGLLVVNEWQDERGRRGTTLLRQRR